MYYLASRCLMMIHLMRYIYFEHLMWFCIILSGTCFRIFSLVMICDHLTSYLSYLLVVSSYLCSNVSIWYCCCFICFKNWKKWVFLYFVRPSDIFQDFWYFLLIPQRVYIPDPHRYFLGDNIRDTEWDRDHNAEFISKLLNI